MESIQVYHLNANYPKISVVIPTLNAAGVLEDCLRSVRQQEYPRDKVEILVCDGGSTDSTRQLAAQWDAVILDNPRRIAEQGKQIAMNHATGEYVLFMDADNELSHADILQRAVGALELNPDALGLESYYLASPRMKSFCVYLTQTLHISDPVSWMLSVTPVLLSVEEDVERWTFPGDSLAYPLGANGFFFRRSTLESVKAEQVFEDTHIALQIALSGRKVWLRLSKRGVHHYVVKSLRDFIRKRRRQTYHFLSLRSNAQLSWTKMKPRVSPPIACFYCVTLVGPIYHTILGLARTRDQHWLWHPLACIASVLGIGWGVITHLTSPKTASAEAGLQPAQKNPKIDGVNIP